MQTLFVGVGVCNSYLMYIVYGIRYTVAVYSIQYIIVYGIRYTVYGILYGIRYTVGRYGIRYTTVYGIR